MKLLIKALLLHIIIIVVKSYNIDAQIDSITCILGCEATQILFTLNKKYHLLNKYDNYEFLPEKSSDDKNVYSLSLSKITKLEFTMDPSSNIFGLYIIQGDVIMSLL
jgi:hypothetical protein